MAVGNYTFFQGSTRVLDHKPPITVLMSCYNGLPYVEEAVQSILAQTFRDFRFIIIDDASNDGSRELLQKLAKQDDRVILLLNEQNLGLTISLNRGIAITDSEWIARMDADDVAVPHRLEKQWRYLNSHTELLLLGSNVIFIDECGKPFPVELIILAIINQYGRNYKWDHCLSDMI